MVWHTVPFFVTFLCARLEAFLSVLNIACCAAFEELLCLWRWRWWCCWGGCCTRGWGSWSGKEAILTFRRDKAPLSFRPTHDWVACRSVPLSLTHKHNEREDSSVQRGRLFLLVSCSTRKHLSANEIKKKIETLSYWCPPCNDKTGGLGSEIIIHTHHYFSDRYNIIIEWFIYLSLMPYMLPPTSWNPVPHYLFPEMKHWGTQIPVYGSEGRKQPSNDILFSVWCFTLRCETV